jgi:hypothetical protein
MNLTVLFLIFKRKSSSRLTFESKNIVIFDYTKILKYIYSLIRAALQFYNEVPFLCRSVYLSSILHLTVKQWE